MLYRYLTLLCAAGLPAHAAILTGTVTASCQASSPAPVVTSAPFGQDLTCQDGPASVLMIADFDEYHAGYAWTADPNLPPLQGSVTTTFIGESTGRFMLTGGSGPAVITDLFPVYPDIVFEPVLYLNGQLVTDRSLPVEFGVPFTVRAVFNLSLTRVANYGNLTHYAYRLANSEVSVRQGNDFIGPQSRQILALDDVPEPATGFCFLAGVLAAPGVRARRRLAV
ncbi:MAG: hypothetical protein IT162_02635 [Bryobacterales bacterium]|nr:hypothetical protein [Bryobacterales bacterium]